jgi:hypothetical protein
MSVAAPRGVATTGGAACERFDHHEAERLFPADREHERASTLEQLDLLVVANLVEHLVVWA